MLRRQEIFLLLLVGLVLAAGFVAAVSEPEGPSTINVGTVSRRIAWPTSSKSAEAGNITTLTVYGKTVTQSWQGFVGNVTGLVVLEDSRNFTLYNWSMPNPRGEIYATYLSSVDWSTGLVKCWDWTITHDASYLQRGEYEGWSSLTDDEDNFPDTETLGMSVDDVDAINDTFSTSINHDAFYVGGQSITANTCPATLLFNDGGTTTAGLWQEVLLFDNKTNSTGHFTGGVIYTSIIEENGVGYDGGQWDFQMIVGENGHNGDISSTPYYFYVELE